MRKGITLFIGLCASALLLAQPKEVTLVVSGEGADKTEATNNALRSAIEQTYQTFVSANTSILNDEIVRDEIVTVSQGNIKSYNEISQIKKDDGLTSIQLCVTVSTGKLMKYAKNHGSTCEFAGASFASNKRLYDFYKANTSTAFSHLLSELSIISRSMYDYQLVVSEPKISGQFAEVEFKVKVLSNEGTRLFGEVLSSTIKAIGLTYKDIQPLAKQGYFFWGYNIGVLNKSNFPLGSITIGGWKPGSEFGNGRDFTYTYAPFDGNKYNEIMTSALNNFVISDNTGESYRFAEKSYLNKLFIHEGTNIEKGDYEYVFSRYYNINTAVEYSSKSVDDFMNNRYNIEYTGVIVSTTDMNAGELICELGPFTARIPVSRLESITSFTIEPKSN